MRSTVSTLGKTMADIITHVLKTAHSTIHQRAADRDVKQERSMEATVKAFNAIHGTDLTEAQGWSFMTLLKMKRSFTGNRFRDDDFVDEAAYTALRAEARQKEIDGMNMEAAVADALAKNMDESYGFTS